MARRAERMPLLYRWGFVACFIVVLSASLARISTQEATPARPAEIQLDVLPNPGRTSASATGTAKAPSRSSGSKLAQAPAATAGPATGTIASRPTETGALIPKRLPTAPQVSGAISR
jgi:hypothetical protein